MFNLGGRGRALEGSCKTSVGRAVLSVSKNKWLRKTLRVSLKFSSKENTQGTGEFSEQYLGM